MFWMLFTGTRASVIQFTPALFSCETVCAYLYSHAVTETVNNVSQYNTGWTDWNCVELDNRDLHFCSPVIHSFHIGCTWKVFKNSVYNRAKCWYEWGNTQRGASLAVSLHAGTLLVSWLEWWWYCTKTSWETWQQLVSLHAGTFLGQVMYKNLIKTRWASELKKNGID